MTLKHIVVACLISTGLWAVGCASLPPAAVGEDLELAATVRDRLGQETTINRLEMGVTVNQGVATLNGSGRDAGAKARALSIIRGTPGIKGVVDNTTR